MFEGEGPYELQHISPSGTATLTTFVVEGVITTSYATQFAKLRTNQSEVTDFAPLKKYFYAVPLKELLLTVVLSGPKIDHSKHVHMQTQNATSSDTFPNIQWDDLGSTDKINTTQKVLWKVIDTDTQKSNMDIDDWKFKEGDLVKVAITNDPNAEHVMQHPIHFHGQRFVVLDRNGVPNNNYVWKDTTIVFPGETINILVEMSNPGAWMAHCHIAEHLHAGMMLGFTVADINGVIPGEAYRQSIPTGMQH